MAAVSSAGPLRVVLITGATTTANGTSQWIDVSPYQNLSFFFKTTGNPGAGTCLIEEIDYDPKTQMVPTTTASAIVTVDIDTSVGTDGQYAYHAAAGRAYAFIRARIGTTVTVATLEVVLRAN